MIGFLDRKRLVAQYASTRRSSGVLQGVQLRLTAHNLRACLLRLFWNRILILCRTLKQQFIGLENTIIAQMPGHDCLGFVAQ